MNYSCSCIKEKHDAYAFQSKFRVGRALDLGPSGHALRVQFSISEVRSRLEVGVSPMPRRSCYGIQGEKTTSFSKRLGSFHYIDCVGCCSLCMVLMGGMEISLEHHRCVLASTPKKRLKDASTIALD